MSDRLIDLFRAVSWKPVEDVVRKLDPEDTEGVPDLYIHRQVFEKMCRIEPPLCKDWLVLEIMEGEPDENGERESWVSVSSTDRQFDEEMGRESRFGLDFNPWSECLGMRVTEESRANYSDVEIVAHSLWEMTFYGTNEGTIQEKRKDLLGRCDAELSKDAIPAEQVFLELGLGQEPEDEAGSALEDAEPHPATEDGYRVMIHPSAVSGFAMLKWDLDDFVENYVIPESNLRNWEINRRNLVLSSSVFDGPRLERISWHPLTGEMILSGRGESYHAMDIHNHGSHPFEEYVRALVLPEKRMVAARPWCPLTGEAASHLDEADESRLSRGGQLALETVLRNAGLPKSWKFVLDIDNPKLEQLTGRRGW